MKKRLLALALCLVMVSSLLPVTAFAHPNHPVYSGLEDGKTYCGEVQFSVSVEGDVGTVSVRYRDSSVLVGGYTYITADGDGKYTLPVGIGSVQVFASNKIGYTDYENVIFVTVNNGQHTWREGTPVGNGKHSLSCSICTATKTVDCADTNGNCECDDCGASLHDWQFIAAGNTLTGYCRNCDIQETLTLKADSVTLPESPFNAQLAGEEPFQAAFPNAVISKIRYDYKGSDGVWHRNIDPIAANAKAGEYQAFVEISNLPGTVLDESGTPLNQASLFVKYTAADPRVTAQTGDNRPIELMMASVLAFSSLAAAAFILDSKRKYKQ